MDLLFPCKSTTVRGSVLLAKQGTWPETTSCVSADLHKLQCSMSKNQSMYLSLHPINLQTPKPRKLVSAVVGSSSVMAAQGNLKFWCQG